MRSWKPINLMFCTNTCPADSKPRNYQEIYTKIRAIGLKKTCMERSPIGDGIFVELPQTLRVFLCCVEK